MYTLFVKLAQPFRRPIKGVEIRGIRVRCLEDARVVRRGPVGHIAMELAFDM